MITVDFEDIVEKCISTGKENYSYRNHNYYMTYKDKIINIIDNDKCIFSHKIDNTNELNGIILSMILAMNNERKYVVQEY